MKQSWFTVHSSRFKEKVCSSVNRQPSTVNRMRFTLFWGLVMGVLLNFTSCGYIKGPSRTPPFGGSPSLSEAVKVNTRTGKLYGLQDFSTILLVSALYKDWSVREAYIREYARSYHLSLKEEARLLDQEKETHSSQREILVALYSDKEAWTDLLREGSPWKVYIDQGEGPVLPEKIERVDLDSALVYKFFDFVTPWTKVYSLKFPPGTRPLLRLIFTSWLGEVELKWDAKKVNF